jgi:hypothetical protein
VVSLIFSGTTDTGATPSDLSDSSRVSPKECSHLTSKPTLDDLPDQVFVALGRRGMEGISLKECTYACDGKELTLIEMNREPEKITGMDIENVVENWTVECSKCKKPFTIRCKIRYVNGERMDTMVNLLDDEGNDLGWLGSY